MAKKSDLLLSKHDLQLPLQHSVVASSKKTGRRLQEVAWRLGFDSLQRDLLNKDFYLPLPTMKTSQLNESFEDFCLWAAKVKNISLPTDVITEKFLEIGYHRQQLTRRLDLVAHLFRYTLERWLLLDRVLFLKQHD
ncbi:MAG: methyltransferase, partial [Shewanella sp.]|nr:methyltransferase [Shewanella sp.]